MATGDPTLLRTIDGRDVPPPGQWSVDAQHTYVGFAVNHLLTTVRARFLDFDGVIEIADDPAASNVSIEIRAASLSTGHPLVDDAARSSLLLDVENFPLITFRSTAVRPSGDNWTVTGDLTLHGSTRPVELHTTFRGVVRNPFGGAKKMSFTAAASFDRADFGIDAGFPVPEAPGVQVVGTAIDVLLEVEANLIE